MTTPDETLVTTAPVEDVLAAIESADLEAPWEEVAPNLCVALPRRRALPVNPDELPKCTYPPGIETILGLDIGPAMLFVPPEQQGRLEEALAGSALARLPFALASGQICRADLTCELEALAFGPP